MRFKIKTHKLLKKIDILKIKQVFFVFFALITLPSQAVEGLIQAHKVDQDKSYGYTLALGGNFFSERSINWQVAYNRLEDVNITWNNDDIDFSLDTVELAVSYRYYPSSYDKFIRSFSVEFQAGAGIALTETKFDWPDLEEEKFFSEQGDVNPFLSVLLHKELSKSTSMHLGIKHYTHYSEFDDISSVFIGFTYRFGRQKGY